MSLFSRLHKTSLNHHHHSHHRHFSSILSPNSTTPLSSKQKSRAALSLLKTEQNPERILDICRSASLTPDSHLDRIAFSLAIQKLSQNHHFTTIHTLLHDLKTTRPDLKTERFISHSIVLYGQATMLDHAIAAFKELHDGTSSSSSSSIPCSIKSLNALLFACILAKDYKQVKTIYVEFPKIYKLEPNLDTFVTVIKAFCESGDSASCYSVLAEMDRKGVKPNATCFGTLLAGFYKEERYEDVGKVLNMMVDKYGMRPGVSVYNIRIQSLCKLKKSVEAKALFDGMCSRRMKPNSVTFCHLIHGFCKEGDLEEGKKLFKRMVNSGCQPDSDCYFTMVHYLCRGGDFETALRIYKESKEKGWVPNFSTMKSLVNGLASVSKVEEAKEIVGEMKEKFKNTVDMWNEVEAALPQ